MHTCKNQSTDNMDHLEQVVEDFFPYSQQKLGFDKPVTIIFQSDKDNSGKMLGKTAYYNPTSFEVVLYTDGRHPKDIMRSLSHELVHHAQNCRGDFTSTDATPEGYAQKDPHLRKMEREAYTKGNLIFRDYEDLIKTGKKDVDIDFTRSGEPEMSLKEWKNGELNTRLMKKWGLLREDSGDLERKHAEANIHDDKEHIKNLKRDVKDDEKELEEGWGYRDEDDDNPVGRPTHRHANPLKALSPEDYEGIGSKEHDDEEGNRPSMAKDLDLDEGTDDWDVSDKELGLHRSMTFADPEAAQAEYEDDPVSMADPKTLGMEPMRAPKWGPKGGAGGGDPKWSDDVAAWKAEKRKRFAAQFKEGKISIREAKEITRRIVERIRKEAK